ncbi:hypothetical protein B0H11DRAFT_2284421 [Mycena galericulata]|nr:hypothetical protein B0H11DRAFT_2284421 [Mycena galericulata]
MAALTALLVHLPDTILEQFRDASFTANFRMRNAQLFSGTSWVDLNDLLAWLRQRGDMDLLDLDSILPFNPRSMDGADVSIQNAVFDGYPAVGFDNTRSATPSSGYSYPYDDYQSSNYSVPASEFDYLDASGSSTPYSGLDLFGGNYESNLDWDPSLAAFFDSAELSFNLDTPFAPAVASGSDASFFLRDPAPSHLQAADPAVFLSPPQDNFKFEDGNLRLMTEEEMDAAGEAWQWAPSSTVWLDKDVSSDVYIPTHPFSITKNQKVSRIERVHGIPSQFPVPRVATAYLVDFSSSRDDYQDDDGKTFNLDKILKDKDCHSWDGTPGERATNRAPRVDGQLFAGIGHFPSVQCRRSRQTCQGIHYCESIDASLINVERYELDPHARDAVNNAQIMQRLNQGSQIQDKAICHSNTVKGMKCTAKNASGGACGGYQIQELPSGRKYYFACSNRSSSWTNHSGIQIPPDVDEDLCIRAFRGESITDGALDSTDPTGESCSRIIGSGSGKKGKSQCPFPHTKDGKSYVAPMCKLSCQAAITFLIPRTNAPKRKAPAAGELDGIWMAPPEVEAYALQENDEGDSHNELMGPANTADGDAMVSPPDDADLGGPFVDPISLSAPSPAPPRSESPAPSSTRRSTRKRGASKTHDDAPAPKLKKMQATIAPEASTSVKKRGKRKAKPWSVRHTDDKIYTSFEFLARFPEEYRDLYGDTPPA